jgi:tetratricopeptide (TPR) repeat protein
MLEDHPGSDLLERFVLGDVSGAEAGSVVRHLASGCADCLPLTAEAWRAATEPWQDTGSEGSEFYASYGPIFQRVFARVREASGRLAKERGGSGGAFQRLIRHPVERQLLLVGNSPAFINWGLCERLLAEGTQLLFADPQRMRDLYRVAVDVALRLDPLRYDATAIEDLRGRAWTTLANAHRVLSDFRASELALREGAAHLAAGSGNPRDRAWFLNVEALLRAAQDRYEESERLLGQAIGKYRQTGDRHAVGRALITRGAIRGLRGDPEGQIVLVREGLELIDVSAEPRAVVTAWHGLIRALHDLGRNSEALTLLARARPLYLRSGDRTLLIHFQWLEGNLCAAVDRAEQAEGCLREARRAWAELEMVQEVALTSLDLAELLSRQGRHAEVRSLAAELIAVARSREIHTEALAAMLVFQRAAESEQVTKALVKQVADALDRGPVRSQSRSSA